VEVFLWRMQFDQANTTNSSFYLFGLDFVVLIVDVVSDPVLIRQ